MKEFKELSLDPENCWMIGDRMTDVEAGHRAKMKSIFIEGTEDPNPSDFAPPEFVAKDFTSIVDFILSQ